MRIVFNRASTSGILHKENHIAFLNCVEKCSQEQLLEILLLLYLDSFAETPNTLEEYQVQYKHVIKEDLTNQIQKDAFSVLMLLLELSYKGTENMFFLEYETIWRHGRSKNYRIL